MTTYFVRHLSHDSLTVAAVIAGASLTTAAAQPRNNPPAPAVDRAALERQAEINSGRHARNRTLRRDERGSRVAAAPRGLPPEGPCRARQHEARYRGLGQRRMLGRCREQPLPFARDRLAWLSRDRQRPYSEWSRRTAAGAASSAATRSAPPPRTQVSDLTDAVDWALAENTRAGSPYFGRIDPAQIAYSGWSCGGVQALQVAKDPRVKTLVIHNSGILNNGPTNMTGASVGKEVLQTLHTPVIYIEGGPTDIAYENGWTTSSVSRTCRWRSPICPVGHGGTFNEPNGGAAASVAVSWLNWQLRGDAQSAKRFVGEDCGLCKDAQWSLQRKQFAGDAREQVIARMPACFGHQCPGSRALRPGPESGEPGVEDGDP